MILVIGSLFMWLVHLTHKHNCSSRSRSRSSGSHSSRSFSRSSVSSRSKSRSPEPAPPGVERGDRNYGPPQGRYMWVPTSCPYRTIVWDSLNQFWLFCGAFSVCTTFVQNHAFMQIFGWVLSSIYMYEKFLVCLWCQLWGWDACQKCTSCHELIFFCSLLVTGEAPTPKRTSPA